MISKFQKPCGFEYTKRLKKMYQVNIWTYKVFASFLFVFFIHIIQDIVLSEDLKKKFRDHLKDTKGSNEIDFSIKVLSSGVLPYGQRYNQSQSFSLPSEVITNKFYINKIR